MLKFKAGSAVLAVAGVALTLACWLTYEAGCPLPFGLPVALTLTIIGSLVYVVLAVVPDVVRAYAIGYRDGMAQVRDSSRV